MFRQWYSGLTAKDKRLVTYAVATGSYGIIRKTVEMWDAKLHVKYDANYDKVDKMVPVLLIDKLWITAMSGISSVYLWPLYMTMDMKKAEVAFRGLSSSDYNIKTTKTSITDYMFS